MVLGQAHAIYYKQGGYHLILAATGQRSAGRVNRDELRYIFRNRRLVLGIGLQVDRRVARSKGSRELFVAGRMKAECGFTVVR